MTPPLAPTPAPTKWWQTLISTAVSAVLGAVLNHYLGPGPAIAGGAIATGVAHGLPSPFRR